MSMKDTIELSPVMLRTLISDYLISHSDEVAGAIMDSLFANAVAMNADCDNDCARIILSLEIPSSEECRRLLDSGEVRSIKCPASD